MTMKSKNELPPLVDFSAFNDARREAAARWKIETDEARKLRAEREARS